MNDEARKSYNDLDKIEELDCISIMISKYKRCLFISGNDKPQP
jgi:hypothetical protein